MDLLCDTLLLEEILPRLPPKHLLRLGVTSRRYNALARRPDFAARYWRRAGVFLQPASEHRNGALPVPRFLTGSARQAAELVPGADLAEDGVAIIVHSASGGLLLCSSSPTPARTARFYVYNPVTRQRVALPELRGLCYKPQCALLTVAGDAGATRFQVVLIEEWQLEDTFLQLKIFDSDTGRWKSKHLSLHMYPSLPFEPDFGRRPVLGPSGAAYWIQRDDDEAIAYDGATSSLRVIRLPGSRTGGRSKLCIGECHGAGRLRFARADESALEVWDSETAAGGAWVLAHRVGIAELPGQESDAASRHRRVKPVGFHPTDVDVVFLAFPAGGVAAYSMEHGTMNLLCAHDCFANRADVFPYVHPPCPVQIPAIKNSASALPRKRKADEEMMNRRTGPRRQKDESS